MAQFFLSNVHEYVHIAGADGQALYPASCPAHFLPCQCAMPVHTPALKGEEVEVVVVRLGEGRATVPIFHPVNKLQKQMDLGAEIHLALLE